MSYFKNFSLITYDYTIKSDPLNIIETIPDLTERINLNISLDNLAQLCNEYLITSNTKPEQLSAILYNDPLLHWTILYINGISNLSAEWPLSDIALSAYITTKYGVGNEFVTHHYEKMPEGIYVDYQFCIDTYGETPTLITNYDYESMLNDQKRIIKVIKPEYIAMFVQMFNNSLLGK
jgi:hypothetical protein